VTADELHAAVDETDTRGLTGFVLLTFHEPDGMRVGASVDDMETVALALRQALLVVESAQRGAMN